jgi:hypothetical protein
MKFRKLFLLFLAPILLTASMCKKKPVDPIDQLPPATQTGANTFGCLVNGKVYIPKGYSGTGTPNPKKIFATGLNGLPYLQIDARQYDQNVQNGSFIINIDSLIGTGIYSIYTNKKQIGFGSYLIPSCGILPNDDTQYKSGIIQVTKYDLTIGIISGLFSFKIKPSNCDTLFFTDGRFDFKL